MLTKAAEHDEGFKHWCIADERPFLKGVLFFDRDGAKYDMMIINLLEVFNYIMKGVCNLPITVIMKMAFIRLNKYFIDGETHVIRFQQMGRIGVDKIKDHLQRKIAKSFG